MELFEHQKKIIQDDPKRCLLALGTGSSKTRIMAELMKGKTVVISPKQQRVDRNFERTMERFNINGEVRSRFALLAGEYF